MNERESEDKTEYKKGPKDQTGVGVILGRC